MVDIREATKGDVRTLAEENLYRASHNVMSTALTSRTSKEAANITSELDVTIRGLEMVTVELAVALCSGLPKALTADLQVTDFSLAASLFPKQTYQIVTL